MGVRAEASLTLCTLTICYARGLIQKMKKGKIEGVQYRESRTYLLQNHTRTTSFSIAKLSANMVISSEVGFGFCMKAFSSATLTLVSIEVLFFRRLPMASGVVSGFEREFGLFRELSASSSHFCRRGFSLHMFLKERFSASNLGNEAERFRDES